MTEHSISLEINQLEAPRMTEKKWSRLSQKGFKWLYGMPEEHLIHKFETISSLGGKFNSTQKLDVSSNSFKI